MSINVGAIQQKMQPVVSKMESNVYLKALSDGLGSILSVIIVGSIFSLLVGIPVSGYQNFISYTGIKTLLNLPITFTINIIAIFAVFFIAYNLAEDFGKNGTMAGLLALISFFIVTPLGQVSVPGKAGQPASQLTFISFDWLGARGFFVAILVGLIAARLYVLIVDKGFAIKMPAGVPQAVSDSFTALIPAFAIVILFIMVSAIFKATSFGNVHQLIYSFLQKPLTNLGGTFGAWIVMMLVIRLLWFFGIHGGMVTLPLAMSVWLPLDLQNIAAYSAGQPLPNILGFEFGLIYSGIGGSGATLGLATLMAFKSRSKRYRVLGKLSFLPGVFNINEPLLYGTPFILNPIMAIPFILTPVICGTVAYVATLLGIVPRLMGANLPIGVPLIVSGFLQGSWKIALLQVIMLAIEFVMYYPFFKILDKKAYEEEQAAAENA